MPPKYAVIPAAGEGKRIKPYSEKVPKPMIQVQGRPILAYVLDRCNKAGIKNVILVINPKTKAVKNYFGDGTEYNLTIEYVGQPKPEGIGHAIGLTEGVVTTPFAVYLGDELYFKSDHLGFVKTLDDGNASAAIGLIRVDDDELIRRNYSVDINPDTHIIQQLVEKPKVVTNNILGCGSYIFDERIFEAIQKTPRSKKNEIEITDSLNTLTEMGCCVKGYFLGGQYLNVTYPEDIRAADQLVSTTLGTDETF